MFKLQVLILIAITAGPLSAQTEDSAESPATGAAAGANATAEVRSEPTAEAAAEEPTAETPPPPAVEAEAQTDAVTQQEVLANELKPLLAEPMAGQTEEQVQEQLQQINDNASQLAAVSDEGPMQLKALSIQMQSIHARIVEFAEAEAGEVDRLLSELRAAARQTKALEVEGAAAAGDFWLLVAELADMNRMTPGSLAVEARREQSAQLMRDYLQKYPESGPSEAVRVSLVELEGESGSTAESAEDAEESETPEHQDSAQ